MYIEKIVRSSYVVDQKRDYLKRKRIPRLEGIKDRNLILYSTYLIRFLDRIRGALIAAPTIVEPVMKIPLEITEYKNKLWK